uniref:Uncharacterized protein n=1 Tax=Meloidogyne enterolobii TaxID=390850 RepID=A0A6V7UDS7_MELEN|nr:unnamed protein product [Meloidogyne enterolobii]
MPPQTTKQTLSKQGPSNNKRINNNTSSLITPSSSTRKYSSSLQQKSPSNKLNNSTIPCPTQMSSSNTSTILSPPDSAELNISQCSNISTENNKTKQRKQCFSMPTSATQSMVASTSTASASLRSSLLSGNDRPKSLLPLQSSKLIRPSNIGRTTNKNTKQNEKQQANILTNPGGKPLMSRISTKSGFSATNSPQNNNTEKKPVLAVKGVSVLSTTPATQRRRPSNSNCSPNIVPPSTDQNISADSSLVEQQKRNRENVAVGVVSPITLDNAETIIDNTMGIPLMEEKEEEPLKFKEKINNNEEKNNKQKSSSTSTSTNNQENLSKKDEKKILTKKPSNLNRILLPSTSTTKIGKIKTKENNLMTKTTKILPKGNEKIIREEEECPQSPLMPPPLAPTKLCNNVQLRGELQGNPSLYFLFFFKFFPNEEEVLTKNLHQNQQQIQHFRLAITAASNDSTTSQDSLDSVRTAIHCPNKELNNSPKQQMPQKIKQLESIPGTSGEILRENPEILTLKRRENEQTKEKGLINNKQVIERLSEPRKITSDTNNSTRHSSTTISSMLKSDGTKNYRYAKDDCINFYAASSCSSLSSALSEPLDDYQVSTSDLTTASSSGDQNSPEKHPNMEFIGFRAPHPPQRQQQFLQPPKMRSIQTRGSPSNLMGPLGTGMPVSNKWIQQQKMPTNPQQWQQQHNNNRYSVATTSDITRPSTSCSGNNVQHFSSSDGGHILLRNSVNNSGTQWTDPKESTNINFYAQPPQYSGGAFEEYSPQSSTSQSSHFRAYHTFTSANFQQIQQQRNQQRRILSPPHHLMALSDDGDTLSVAAGEIGGQQQQMLGNMRSSAFGRRPQVNGQEIGENINDSPIRHPAYHTHSLDRHAHLRIFQQPRIPPIHNGVINNNPIRNGNIKLTTTTSNQSKQFPSNNNQFNSLLISPRHFAYPSSTFASTPNNQMIQQDKKIGSNNGSSRIYSNLQNNNGQQKFSSANNSCLNSPNKIQLISSDEIIQQPGSQLSLVSSLGSAYTNTIEERYEWEVNKLQNELESYRTTVSLLNQRHSGYNCMLQIFDSKLQTIMLSLSKLQQKRHVKRNEVERLCREIEHLRSLSISAGVVPKEQQQLNLIKKENNNNSLPPPSDNKEIEKEKNIKIINEKSSSVGRGEQTDGGGKKAGWIRSSFTRAFQKGSSKKNKQTQQQINEEEKQQK